MLTEQQWKLRLGMYKSDTIDFKDIYRTIVEQCTEASNSAKPIVSSSVIELANEAKMMKENSAKLKAVIDKWLKVLEDGNKKYAEMEAARKYCY